MTSYNVKEITYGSYINYPKVSKEGYELIGWYYNNKKINTNDIWTLDPGVDTITVVARWKVKQ